jgi:hypothetical protein
MADPSTTPSSGQPLIPSRAIFIGQNIDAPDVGEQDVTGEEVRSMPYDGVVSQIYLDIPSGVRSKAGFRILDSARGVRKFPYNEETEYASFDDVSGFWPVSFPLEQGDEIKAEFINENQNQNVDAHFLKVWLIVVGIEALPYTLDDLAKREGVDL